MLLPSPPLNEHGRLAVNTADIADHLVTGLTSSCSACDHSAIHYWRMPTGEYFPVHPNCAHRVIEHWTEQINSGETNAPDLATGARRGAYARRASPTGARVHPPRAKAQPSRSLGSPWFRPGMPEGTPWVLITETHNGRMVTMPSSASRERTEAAMGHYRALAAQHLPISPGGPLAVGGALMDPTGAIVATWGEAIELSAPPRWEAMGRVENWRQCAGCLTVLWPMRLISQDGRCRTCVTQAEENDPRVWLFEPAKPPLERWPERFGGPKRKKKAATKKHEAVN